jgi:hypothetical protein
VAKKVGFKVGETVATVAQPGQPSRIGVVREIIKGGAQNVLKVQLDGAQHSIEYRADQIRGL